MQSSQMILKTSLWTFCRCRVLSRSTANLKRCAGVGFYSTEAVAAPIPEGAPKTYSPKIHKLVEDIGGLTLLEVADLNELLKRELKIQDAPVMAMGGMPMPAAPKEEEEEEPELQRKEKSLFTVKLLGFDDSKKIALIKELKNLIPGTNLVQAKKIVESSPVELKADILKAEAEELKKAVEGVGGKVELL